MLNVVFLSISKLDGPPLTFVPPSAAESRDVPLRCYDFHLVKRDFAHIKEPPEYAGRFKHILAQFYDVALVIFGPVT